MAVPMDFGGLLPKGKGPAAPAALELDVEVEEAPGRERLVSASQEVLDAVAGGSAEDLADALEAAVAACGAYKGEE